MEVNIKTAQGQELAGQFCCYPLFYTNPRCEHLPITCHTVSHVTLLVSSGKFMSGSAFFLSPPENKKAKFAFCTLKRKGGSTQKQPFLTVRFRGALLTKSVTLEFSQDTVCLLIFTNLDVVGVDF